MLITDFLGAVHRLDSPTSGVLMFAKTTKAAARLCEHFRRESDAKSNLKKM
jgi:23S rRNA pseudouridine1911/1915/1917 synthase